MHAHVMVVPHSSGTASLTEYHVWGVYQDADDVRRSVLLVRYRDWRRANEVANTINGFVPQGNEAAVFAATEARGPRCDHCGLWTYRPEYLRLPYFIARLCPDCFPLPKKLGKFKALMLIQEFKSDLEGRDLTNDWPVKL